MVTPILLETHGSSRLLKIFFWTAVNLFSAAFILFLYLIKPFKFLKLFLLIDDKIGHLAANTDLFLRRIQNGAIKIEKGAFYIAIASKNQPNLQLFKMFKRKLLEVFKGRLKVVQISEPNYIQTFLRAVFSSKSLFGRTIFYQPLFAETYYTHEFSTIKPNLSFTPEEERHGKKLLRKIGMKEGSWFVCFHNRDSTFLKQTSDPQEWKYYNYRDSDINNYLKAAQYITSKGGFAVRMGSIVSKKLPSFKNPRIIDYASKFRADFLDIYLLAKCKFLLVSTSGLTTIAAIFNRPIALANIIPVIYPPIRKDSIYIPKKIWSKKEKRFLKFSEMIGFEGGRYTYTKDFNEAGLVQVENTPKEIYELAKEMYANLNGKYKYTKEDEKLQKKFRDIFQSSTTNRKDTCIGTNFLSKYNIRIGAKFLRENKDLLT